MLKENYFLTISNREWLLTNGVGGYALGTGNLINQRKYHGLLISSDDQGNRYSLLSGLEILVEWRGGTFHIDSTNYSNCIYPEGFLHLVKSWLRPYPVFLYSSLIHNNDIMILIELMMADNDNTVMVRFTNLGSHKLHFHIRPKLTLRNHHWLNPKNCWDNEHIELQYKQNTFSVNRINNKLSLYGAINNGFIREDKVTFHDCYYPWEAIRGYYGVEDILSPFLISFDLQVGEKNYLLFSDREDILKEHNHQKLDGIADSIANKYQNLPLPADSPLRNSNDSEVNERLSVTESLDYSESELFSYEDYLQLLELSLRDFLIKNDIIAGYPWFGSWGRDTFISLEALFYLPDVKMSYIWDIFDKYGSLINNGLLPNMLSESGQAGNYDSCDACLWYVVSSKQFVDIISSVTKDENTLTLDIPVAAILYKGTSYCDKIINGLYNNEHYPFHIGEDGLLYLEDDFSAATWMDAKVGGQAVTPRTGAPVEINALLFNALCSFRDILSIRRPERIISDSEHLDKQINLLSNSFQRFYTDDYLADRISNEQQIREYRPNAIIAVSLPYSLISQDRLQTILATGKQELLTAYGLRTLAPKNYLFKKKYLGNQKERDNQYHQGTTWSYLLMFYARSYQNAYSGIKPDKEIVAELESITSAFRNDYIKGYTASVAEVWDGYKPGVPKGCPAQAWSVASLYLIEKIIKCLRG